MKVTKLSSLPKRDYCPAAKIRLDFDSICRHLGVKPERGTFRDGLAFPNRYRSVCLELSTGRYATLTQTEMRQSIIEIGLEIADDEFFHEADLLEVSDSLGVDHEYVKRYQGDFTWIPASSNDRKT